MTTFNFISNKKHFLVFGIIFACLTLFSTNMWGETSPYSATATSAGAIEGWTGSGTGTYSGAVKFDSDGDSYTNTSIWSGDVSSGMTSISVTLTYTMNGSGDMSSNVFTVYAVNSSGTTKASATFTPNRTSYGDVTVNLTISSGANVTGLKLEYTDKVNRNFGLQSISATATYSTGSSHTITATRNNDSYGTVEVSGTTITATPAAGYRVIAGTGGYTVTDGTATVTNNGDNTFTVSASTDCTIQINFEYKGCSDHAGTNVTSGESTDYTYGPVDPYYEYSTRQILYTKTDLGLAAGKKGTIKSIYFEYGYSSPTTSKTDVTIYMVNTNLTALSTSNYVTVTDGDIVYTGPLNCSNGWNEIELSTPFSYNGIGNLVVVIDDNSDAYDGTSYVFKYHTANTTTNAQLYTRSASTDADPKAAATWTGASTTNNRPNTKFCILEQDLAKFTVTFDKGSGICGTDELTEENAGDGVTLPTATHSCAEWTFAGWAEASVGTETTTAPTLFAASSNYKPSGNISLYAVYKRTEGDAPKTYTLTINTGNIGTGYSGLWGANTDDTIQATATDASTYAVEIGHTDCGLQSSNFQFKKTTGCFWNTNDLGTINSVTINTNTNIDYYIGTTEEPSAKGSGGYFKVYNTTSNAQTITSVVISFTKGSGTTYYHSTPSCTGLQVTPTSLDFGTKNISTNTDLTITVTGTELTANASLSISGANAGMFSVTPASLTQTAGVISGTDNVTVRYTPTEEGTHSATLTITSGTSEKTVTLTGTCALVCTTPTLAFAGDVTSKEALLSEGSFTLAASATGNTLGATISYSSSNINKAEVSSTGVVTLKQATGSGSPVTITATLAAINTGVACQNEVTASYTLTIYNEVKWLVNGVEYTTGSPTTQTTQGASITAYPTDPDGSTLCGGNTFVGWTTEAYKDWDASTKPATLYTSLSDMNAIHINENTNYYAVFVSTTTGTYNEYKKGTSGDLTAGQKVIIVNTANNKAFKAADSFKGTVDVSPSENKFTTTDNTIVWTVEKPSASSYYFKYGSNYLNCLSSNPYIQLNSTTDAWTLTGSGPYVIVSGNYTGRALEYYSGNFTSFATGTGNAFNMDFYVPNWTGESFSTACGPTIKADEVERLTSYKNQTVKSQSITVRGGNLGGATLTADISGADAGLFSCTLASSTITTGAINTTYVISYTPTAFGDAQHTATLRFTDGTTYSDPITLRGRSLPEHFAIVGKAGDNYYVLDGTMTGSAGLVTALPVTVTAGVIDKCPSQAVYTLTERATPDQNVHFVGPTGRRLYGEGSGTGLNTHSGGATDGTGWLLSTTDFETYHITNATTTDHGIMYRSTNDVFGHYATSNYSTANYYGDLRLLPFTEECTCLNRPVVTRTMKEKQVTISWEAVTGADHYRVTCSNGYDNDAITGTSVTVTGLTGNTTYTFTVQAIASGTDCSLIYSGSFKTAICDDVPYDVLVMPGVKTATIRWKMDEASSATIRFYSDAECNTEISEKALVGVTSPCNVTGLEENTQYYIKIFAGGTCASSAYSLFTQTTEVEVAEWFPDSIRIVLNDVDADAYVLIEDKQENKTASTNVATGLFFSKYYEAYLSVKLWAIYNGTKEKISLANVVVKSANNGNYWGKDNTTGTGADNSQKVLSFATFGHYESGYIYPGEEIIVYSPGQATGTQDHNIIECMENTYGTAYKTDPDSLWYKITNQTTSFSGDDGLMLLDGTDTLDVIGGKNAYTAWQATSKPSWGDASGWNCPDGEDVEGNTLALSTNRCLLVRKNTVKNGLNAAENNTNYFNTLCDEWWGAHVPVTSDEVQTSCDNFSYVGHYDYDKYYAQFDSVTTVDEIGGKRNPDGTYTIPIPMLDTLSCSMMRVKVYEKDGTEKASREYKVPIMVDDTVAWTTNDTIFHNSKHNATACAECDVVILKGATLTKTNAGANDVTTIRNLTIYPGGTMVVPNTRTFNVSSVQFRVEGERAPQAKLQGDLITSDQQVIVTRRINNDRYYFFSLPYDCNVSDIRWSNGETPVRGTDYQILEYDAVTRAAEGSTKGAPGHWKNAGNVLHAGVGYNVAVNSKYLKELIFPMAIGQTNLTDKEDNKSTNKVTLAKNVGPTSKNNHNWNLVAHPYVSPFNAYSDAKITAGYLEVEFINDGLDTIWHRKETSNVYLTMPSFAADKITYTQTLSAGTLDPFLAVFVQAASEGDLTFDQSNRKLSAPSRRWAAKAENEDQSIFVGVTLSGNGQSDQTNLRIRPDFTNEYQLGYDLQKFTTYYTSRPQIYMKPADLQLAFQAVNDDAAKTSFIPVGVYCYKAGTYTFALSEDYPIDEVEAVYLHDATTGETTNLLYDTYTITTDKQLYTNARFSLNVIVNRRAPQVTTDIDVTNAPDNLVRKILINGHVYIQRGAELYDVTGKQMSNL